MGSVKYIYNKNGQKKSAIVPIKEYEELLDIAQDALDMAEIEAREDDEYYKWEDAKKELLEARKNA